MFTSSPGLAEAFIEGARQQGCDVIDYGMLPTDVMYFAVCRDSGGAQITASHNPKEYNGVKLVSRDAKPLSGDEGIREIREMIVAHELPRQAMGGYEPRGGGRLLDRIFRFIDPSIVEPQLRARRRQQGMGGLSGRRCSARLPRTSHVAMDVDGAFSFHESNPLIEENRRTVTQRDRREGRHRLGRRQLLLHRRHGRFRGGRLRHGAARRGLPDEVAGREDSVRRARRLHGGRRRRAGGTGDHQPRRARVHQAARARREREVR